MFARISASIYQFRVFLNLMVAVGIACTLMSGDFSTVLAGPDAPPAVFLPFIQGNKPTATTTPDPSKPTVTVTPETPTVTVTPETPTTTPANPIAFFADMQWRTANAAILTDAQGGRHLVHTYYQGFEEGVPTGARYLYCPANCDQAGAWQGVTMGELVNEIQIALTPQGRPRILYRTANDNHGSNFYYAVCNQECTKAGNWQSTHILTNEGMAPVEYNDDELPQRSFALDPQGRPRLVYNDRKGTHYGTFYAFCDENCLDPANWNEVRINKDNTGSGGPYRDEDFFYPALTFSPTGQPRVLVDGVTMQDEFFLTYVACDSGCDQPQNWQSAYLFPRGQGSEVAYDIEINAAGDPRIVFYEGALVNGGNRLSYGWCDEGCTNAANWQRQDLGLKVLEGQEPDLELDRAGHPHIAYALFTDGALGYSKCSANCESANGQWQHQIVENHNVLDEAWPVAFPPHCSGGIWSALTPMLSLDGKDAASIAYDATFYARCHYKDETGWEPWHEMNLVWRAVRVRLASANSEPAPVTPTVTPTTGPIETVTPTPTVTEIPTETPTETVEPPARLGVGFFPESNWRTSSSDVAIDSENGTHLVYVYTELLVGPDPDGAQNPTSAVYLYCRSGCDQERNWSGVTFSESVSEVQIELTPDGKPRLLLLARSGEAPAEADLYLYAACNNNCTQGAGWQLAPVAAVPNNLSWHWVDDPDDMEDVAREYLPRRYFALDPQGRPRFVYYHYDPESQSSEAGAYYAACDENCTQPGSWTHTRITEITDWSGILEWEVLERPILTFAPNGSPRILAALTPLGILRFTGLYYIACDGGCDDIANWSKTQIGVGDDVNGDWDLEIDAQGRPHVIISSWWQDGMRYSLCEAACNDPFSWTFTPVEGEEINKPDLELNAQGMPRIAHTARVYDETGNNSVDTLYYLWCDSQCTAVGAAWQSKRVENGHNLRVEWQGTIPPACAAGDWDLMIPTLALNGAGVPRVAVDMGFVGPCKYDSSSGSWQPGGEFTYSMVWRAAHVAMFNQP